MTNKALTLQSPYRHLRADAFAHIEPAYSSEYLCDLMVWIR